MASFPLKPDPAAPDPPQTPTPPEDVTLTLLGTGTCTPSLCHQPAGYLLQLGDFSVLIDSGSGTVGRLMQAGLPVHALDAVVYTHLHLDHTGDLFPMLFSLRNSMGFTRTRDFLIFGPPGFQAFFDHLAALFGRWVISEQYHIQVVEWGAFQQHPLGPFQVETLPMKHTPSSLGYRFCTADGRVVAFTGDADEGPQLAPLLQGAAVAVVDCSTPDAEKLEGHLSPRGIREAVREGRVERLVLSHLYPPAQSPRLLQAFEGAPVQQVIQAQDGMRLVIKPR